MEIERTGAQPSAKGPANWFSGTVRLDPLFSKNVVWMEKVGGEQYGR
jgi:hypothetical protein